MIKPFKIVTTVDEGNQRVGVNYELTKVVVTVDGMQTVGTSGEHWENIQTKTETLGAYISLPADADVEQEIFTIAKNGGWIQ
tara:strand:+ start:1361 stop:1606 length:246 start_codon:yes stop_codon:yes gene_type:complete